MKIRRFRPGFSGQISEPNVSTPWVMLPRLVLSSRSTFAMRRVSVLLVILLAACAAPDPRFRDPTLVEWRAADFGDVPENYDMAIRTYLETVLRDPLSATITIKNGPEKTWIGDAPNFVYGYGVCVTI